MSRPFWVRALGVLLVVASLGPFLPEQGRLLLRGLSGVVFLLVGITVLFRRPNLYRLPWLLILLGGVVAVISGVTRTIDGSVSGADQPFPSVAEPIAWCAGILMVFGILELVARRSTERRWEDILDAVIVAVGFLALYGGIGMSSFLQDGSVPFSTRAATVPYLAVTFLLVYAIARVANGPGERNTAYYLLAAATILTVANDVLLRLDTAGVGWAFGLALVLAPFAFSFATAAMLHPAIGSLTDRPTPSDAHLTRRRLALLTLALLVAPVGALNLRRFWPEVPLSFLLISGGLLSVLVAVRFALLVRSRELATDRERRLRLALADLTSSDDRLSVYATLIEQVVGLRASSRTDAAIIRGGPEGWELITSSAANLNQVSPGHAEAIETARRVQAPQVLELVESLLAPEDAGFLYFDPMDERDVLVVDSDELITQEDAQILELMGSQAQLAISAADLRESLHSQRSERRFSALVRESSELILIFDAELRVSYVSPTIERVLGWSRESLHGRNVDGLVHEEDFHNFRRAFDNPAARNDSSHGVEVRLRVSDGRYRWFDVSVRDFRDEAEVAGLVVTARDITEERTAKENLERSESWFRSLVQSSSDVIAVLDDLGIITYISPAVTKLLGFDADKLTGRSALELIPGDELHRLDELRADMDLGDIGSRDIELRLTAADDTDRVVDITLSDLRGEPSVKGLVLNVRDITDRKSLEHDLRHQALHDELTGLGNRLQFSEHLRAALNDPFDRCQLAVLFVDIDDFKTVNDSLGHSAGDEVLVEVANRLRTGLRPTDRAARLGGDEFAVLFTEIESEGQLGRLADRLVQALSWPVSVQGIDVQVSVSLGIATDDDRTHTAEDLLRSADVAMYQAKDRGKGRWALFEESMQKKARERFDLQNALTTALDDPDEMVPHFQPIVDLATGRIFGVEALVRWFHPELGLVSPAAFIPLAEETGMIVEIGRHVLERSLIQLAEWQAMGHDIYVSVNISAVQLQTDGIVADILGLVDHYGVARHKLVLELTETALVNDFESVITRIDALREAGIQIAIDDFGTGYSSLRYANEFKADILKIDRTFVLGLEFDEQSTVISTVIELARHMGAKTVAEGIELPMMPPRLLRLGCQLGQGYLFARPVPPENITVALAAERDGQTLVGLGR